MENEKWKMENENFELRPEALCERTGGFEASQKEITGRSPPRFIDLPGCLQPTVIIICKSKKGSKFFRSETRFANDRS